MNQIAQNFTLRVALSFTVCASLLLLPGVSLLSEASSQAVRNARPGPKKPEGTLPDLEEVKNESNVEREAPPPIPSTVRARRNEGKPCKLECAAAQFTGTEWTRSRPRACLLLNGVDACWPILLLRRR